MKLRSTVLWIMTALALGGCDNLIPIPDNPAFPAEAGGSLIVNGISGADCEVYVFASWPDLSTYEAASEALADRNYEASGRAENGAFTLYLGDSRTRRWTGSGVRRVLLINGGGEAANPENPLFRLGAVNFSGGTGEVPLSRFNPLIDDGLGWTLSADGSADSATTKLILTFKEEGAALNPVTASPSWQSTTLITGELTKASAKTLELPIAVNQTGNLTVRYADRTKTINAFRGPLSWKLYNNAIVITSSDKMPGGNLEIPAAIMGKPVLSIEANAFNYRGLNGVTIPASVESIGKWAFRGNNLTRIVIPASLDFLADGVFADNQLTEVDFAGSKPGRIGDSAFINNRLTYLAVPASVTAIGENAFCRNQLTTVSFAAPGSLVSIGEGAFEENLLTFLDIPASLESIGGRAFEDNKLTRLDFAGDPRLRSIGASAFAKNKLAAVSIPRSVTEMGPGAFMNNSLASVIIPGSLNEIANCAFMNNYLESVDIPGSVRRIGIEAFRNNLLLELTIPSSVTSIGDRAFSSDLDINVPPYSYYPYYVPAGYHPNNRLTSITIGDTVSLNDGYIYASIGGCFEWAYTAAGRAAGTYTRINNANYIWTRNPNIE